MVRFTHWFMLPKAIFSSVMADIGPTASTAIAAIIKIRLIIINIFIKGYDKGNHYSSMSVIKTSQQRPISDILNTFTPFSEHLRAQHSSKTGARRAHGLNTLLNTLSHYVIFISTLSQASSSLQR